MIQSVKFTAGGVDYEMAFRTSTLKSYQRETGENVVAAFETLQTEPGNIVRLGNLFRVAVTPPVTEDQADEIMDEIGFAEVFRLLGDAAQLAFAELIPGPKRKGQSTR